MATTFPTTVDTSTQLYTAVNGVATTLNGAIDNAVTTITVVDTTNFPSVGYIVIDTEIIKYTGKTLTTFTGCTRGSDGSSAASHTTAAIVNAYIVADHHNVLMNAIIAVETDISARLGIGASSNAIVVPSGVSFTVNSSGGANFTGSASPNLYISSTSGSGVQIRFLASGTTAAYFQTQSNHPIYFTTNNGVNAMQIETSKNISMPNGLISIGTTTYKKRLTVLDATSSNTSPGADPVIWLGGGNGNVNTMTDIGFTYGGSGGDSNVPASIGFQTKSTGGSSKGDLVFCTRDVTTDTVPLERLRIAADGSMTLSKADDARFSITDTGDSSILLFRSDGANTQLGTNSNHNLGIIVNGSQLAIFDNAANRFRVTRSVAGSQVSIQIFNSDNTSGSSNTTLEILTGGGSGGDARLYFEVTGAQSYTQGIDNSDSDRYKLSVGSALGTTDAIIIDPTLRYTQFTSANMKTTLTLQLTIADDSTAALTTYLVSGSINTIIVMTQSETKWSGIVQNRMGGTPTIVKIGGGAQFDTSTSALTGTTGVDGNVTISSQAAAVQIENRSGGSAQFYVTIVSGG